MRTITTDRGKTYEVAYAYAPVMGGGCAIALKDTRPLSQLAIEFDGLSRIHYTDELGADRDFDGYSRLVGMDARQEGITTLMLARPGESDP